MSLSDSVRECRYSLTGVEYVGRVNITASGRPCRRWDSDETYLHAYGKLNGPAEESQNYCRNPSKDTKGPWCLVGQHGESVKEFCDIPFCRKFG